MIDPLELALALAKIASQTEELATARRLMELIDRLLTDLGLPPAPTDDRS